LRGAQSNANFDLLRSLAHRVGHNAIDANGCEDDGPACEDQQQPQLEPGPRDRIGKRAPARRMVKLTHRSAGRPAFDLLTGLKQLHGQHQLALLNSLWPI
jgi:hypothetical protein